VNGGGAGRALVPMKDQLRNAFRSTRGVAGSPSISSPGLSTYSPKPERVRKAIGIFRIGVARRHLFGWQPGGHGAKGAERYSRQSASAALR
jgi:hypothetical protein